MKKKEPIVMSWSGGKDSSFALYKILKEKKYDVKYLLTNIFEPNKRVSMHGVPEILIEKQAESIGIPLIKLYINEKSHEEYENTMREFLNNIKAEGINTIAFGDIFLEDLKKYREQKLAEVEMKAMFPLWKNDTYKLAKQFLNKGFKTHICSIDASKVPNHLVGIDYSTEFLKELPKSIDPCGENGEFHSFCYDGPIFKTPIPFNKIKLEEHIYNHNNHDYKYIFSSIEF